MTKWIVRVVGIVLLLSGLAFLGWFIPAKAGMFASDREEMVERYADAPSQFITVDGVPIHVRVEGNGAGKAFPLLMLHGSLVNMHEFDPTAERLKKDYRIIRVDWPPYGLSGPNPKGYTTPEAARLVALVLDKLNVQKVGVISTSNGANVALSLNAMYPERVAAMAFSILPIERPSQTRDVDWKIKTGLAFHEAVMPEYHPMIWYRWILHDTGPKTGWNPPQELSQIMYDMGNLPNAISNQKQYLADNTRLFKTTDYGAVAEQVKVPVLLQWCWDDTVISQGPEATVRRFTNTQVKVIEYKGVGHWPMWEIPDRFANDNRAFFDAVGAQVADAAPAPQP